MRKTARIVNLTKPLIPKQITAIAYTITKNTSLTLSLKQISLSIVLGSKRESLSKL
jgi:hypothetical protein